MEEVPKVFISYAWGNKEKVLSLAERLKKNGVDVMIDVWKLKEGQDKYVFMEQCVSNPDICKVLIICDKEYTQKADSRTGGVGDETAIISPEIYGKEKQEKFIPVIFEKDYEGNPYQPVYVKSRIYIDLSDGDNYEDGYDKLVRNIFNKPLYKEPPLGRPPEWLDCEKINFSKIKDIIKQIKGTKPDEKEILIDNFADEYINKLIEYHDTENTALQVYKKIEEMKTIRDIFLDFLDTINDYDNLGNKVADIFENLYNKLLCYSTYNKSESHNRRELEIFRFHIWELFICVTAFFLHYNRFEDLNSMLGNTYFLNQTEFGNNISESCYTHFYHYSSILEEEIKPNSYNPSLYTLMGDMLCSNREKRPIYTRETLANADLFLYQVFNAYKFSEDMKSIINYWFPRCYVYASIDNSMWIKLKSKKFCEKIYPLFKVTSLEELKSILEKCKSDKKVSYVGYLYSAPAILNYVKLEDIGSLN